MKNAIAQNTTVHSKGNQLVALLLQLLLTWVTFLYFVPPLFAKVEAVLQLHIAFLVVLLAIFAAIFPIFVLRKETIFGIFVCTYFVIVGLLNGLSSGLIVSTILPLLLVFCYRNINWNYENDRFLYILSILIYIAMTYQFLRVIAGTWTRSTSFNENTIAIVLFISVSIIFINLRNREKQLTRITCWVLIFIAFLETLLLHCRTTAICLLLFIVMSMFHVFEKKPQRIVWIAVLICFLGIIAPAVYIALFKRIGIGTFTVMGKDMFTGREYIWNVNLEFLNRTARTLMLGTNEMSYYNTDNSLHNMYLQVLVRYGVTGSVLYWSFFIFYIRENVTRIVRANRADLLPYIYLVLCLLIYGFSETSFLWSMFAPIAMLPLGILDSKALNGFEQ